MERADLGKKRKTPLELNKRERQIYETVVALKEATVNDVMGHLEQAPSYSAVRSTMGLLVDRGWLKYRRDGKRFVYRPAASLDQTRRTATKRLVSTFFGGSASDAMASLLDVSSRNLSPEQLDELIDMIKDAKKENGDVD